MAELFGKKYRREELLRRVGNTAQVAGVREYTYNSGRADGVKAVEIDTGAMRFEVLPSRCLDIASLSYRGVPFGYRSKSGLRHPAFYAKNDPTGFQDNFLAGVLTTCGMHNIGPAAAGGGRPHQLHGELPFMPAEKVAVTEVWEGDGAEFAVAGEVSHAAFYHEDLLLRRRISSSLGASRLVIEDEVENRDFAPSPCLLLYHIQFGFPLLGEASRLLTTPPLRSEARPGTPGDLLKDFASFGPPVDGAEEACFYHTFKPDADGCATACLFNPELGDKGLGAYVRFRTDTLPLMVQWKMLRSREYVCGLEPATARLDDRDPGECLLAPLEKRRFHLELGVVEGEDGFRNLLARG